MKAWVAFPTLPMNVTERLAALSAEIAEEQIQLRILEDQLLFQSEVADDARIRALVSETPLADRESQIASDDLRRLERSRDEARRRLSDLRAEQDSLLERMLDEAPSQGA
ncbi:MAG: hypothetical protein ACRDKG_10930 [Actinomycetota bacterium]